MTDVTIEQKLSSLADEALELRSQSSMPGSEATPQEVLNSLLDQRWRADRMEAILTEVIRLRGRVGRATAQCKAAADDVWTQALVDARKSSAKRGDQFEGPRERYADADLVALSQRRELRKAENLLSLADEVSEIMKTASRGLSDIIQDHRTWLKALQFQSYLEK